MSNLKCPEEVAQRAKILYYNGFGYQFTDELTGCENGYFVIAKLSDEIDSNTLSEIMDISETTTLGNCENFLGYNYLKLLWNEHHLIDIVLTTLLQKGISFTTNNELEVYFNANKCNAYSRAIAEHKFIEQFNEFQDKYCENDIKKNIYIMFNNY